MLDINKALTDPNAFAHDPEGHMFDLEPWSRHIAQNMAREEGLGNLSDKQWQMIYRLRGQYRRNGRAESARQLMHAIEPDFAEDGGSRYLYRLFPQGPIAQGSRLAGVPAPPYSDDLSFGSFG